MNRKIISICLAATVVLSSLTAFAAIDEKLYSTDSEEVKTVITNMSETDMAEFVDKNLTKEMQHLSRLVTMSSNQALDKIGDEVEAAIDDGLTPVQIKEAIYHSGAYCGYTRAAKALDAADEKLAAMGYDTPYQTRITSKEETRYDDGLAVQRYLFGPQIGTITDDMSEAMKLQTLYLSGICFGDFYNRIGLPLYTREFLTFCTIAGNGNCQGQITGHTNGNLMVGHAEYDEAVTKARAAGTIRERGETMFPKGEAYTAEGYTGVVYKNLLVEHEEVFNSPEFDNYTMENNARTAWHSNESGELIIVTDGEGIYQEEDSEPVIIKAGDIIIAQPGINHWYGAVSNTFAYIGVNGGLEKNAITWGDVITEEEYVSLIK